MCRDALLHVVLEAVERPALVIDVAGRIVEANALALALLQAKRGDRPDALVTVAAGGASERWESTRVDTAVGRFHLLVTVRRSLEERLAALSERAATRWQLSRRQTEVLGKVCEGYANQTIGSIFGISERTVEVHITSLLRRASAVSRTELIAKAFLLA